MFPLYFLFYLHKHSKPIDFEKAKKERYDVAVEKLKDVRKAQFAFKDVYGRYTSSWDTLINFVMYDKVINVRKVGELNDSMAEAGITEKKALEWAYYPRQS